MLKNKSINGKVHKTIVLSFNGGFKRIKSPYLADKKSYISLFVDPSLIFFLIKILKSLANSAEESSID